MVQSRAVRLSICAPESALFTVSEAVARSAVRPTRVAVIVTGGPGAILPPFGGLMVRTMGGSGAGDGLGGGDALMPGDGLGRGRNFRASLGCSVGGTPAVAGASVPGAAPRSGRSV